MDENIFLPSIINDDMNAFATWLWKTKPSSRYMLQAEFSFHHGSQSIGVCEAIVVGLEESKLVFASEKI